MSEQPLGPTGAICRDLPSPYQPDLTFGLMHLPRFLAKIRKHLRGELPKSYQKNFCRGFDRFLCMHLGVDPQDVVAAVKAHDPDETALFTRLQELFPENVEAAQWNREVTHKGQTEAGREFLAEALTEMGTPERVRDIVCVCDLIDFDEGRIPGYDPVRAAELQGQRQFQSRTPQHQQASRQNQQQQQQ
ncbi:MAG: hypothetical protein E1N59_1430 [Puniceicoccaceae bacterium 5H]|nr:MAG: hypothetical protein E1N59_1430 [Puniceicoccaceae bacterium 5H]